MTIFKKIIELVFENLNPMFSLDRLSIDLDRLRSQDNSSTFEMKIPKEYLYKHCHQIDDDRR